MLQILNNVVFRSMILRIMFKELLHTLQKEYKDRLRERKTKHNFKKTWKGCM